MSYISNHSSDDSECEIIQLNMQLPQRHVPDQSQTRFITQETFELMELRLHQMEEKLKTAANLRLPVKNYIYNGKEALKKFIFIFIMIYLLKITKEKDLVNDFHSRDPEKWALRVVDHLFTKQELADHVIVVNF
jgi:hypothetical protein